MMAEGPRAYLSWSGNLLLDGAVIDVLTAAGQKVVSAERYGSSALSQTARITAADADSGEQHNYFLKIDKGDYAAPRSLGEYSCMSELYKTMPSLVPTPRGWGKCADSDTYFYLCDYVEIDHRPPNPVKLGQKIAELHQTSVSPTGKFGFHVPPYDGKLPLESEWDSSWVSFFRKLLERVYKQDVRINGNWDEFDRAMKVVLEQVIPRLLGPLEEDGRSVKPCLIHGDLWEENIGTNPRTGELYIFDSCAYYAHHEMGVAMWRVDHHQMKAREYRNEYFKNFEPDEPMEEYDDRSRLYSLKEMLMYSAHVPGTKARAQALGDMEFLIKKYVTNEQ